MIMNVLNKYSISAVNEPVVGFLINPLITGNNIHVLIVFNRTARSSVSEWVR